MSHLVFQLVTYLIIVLVLISAFGVLFRPYLAIPLVFSLYAVEQILMRFHPFFQGHPTFYNYFIGLVCFLGLLFGYQKNGVPKPSFIPIAFLLFGLLMLSWCSFLWTSAPKSAFGALLHFTLEAPLMFFLPLFTISKPHDYKVIAIVSAFFALGLSMVIIFSPVSGISGRNLLIAEGTVLSPSTTILTAIIFFLFTRDYEKSGIITIFSLSIPLIMLLALFMLGARIQFFLAVIITFYCYIFFIKGKQKFFIAYSLSILIAIGSFMFFTGLSLHDYRGKNKPGIKNEALNMRFTIDDLVRGVSQRIEMITPAFSSTAPLFGNGIMSWSHLVFGKDEYRYPHNSVIQLYYEVGIIGLFLFLGFNFYGVKQGMSYYNRNKNKGYLRKIGLMLLCYWLSSFILSLKQETFMSCIGIYTAIGMLSGTNQNFFDKEKLIKQKGIKR